MDDDYRASSIPSQLCEDKSLEENLQLFRDDLKVRYPQSTRRMNLFMLERGENEDISPFIARVKMEARYAECDKLPIDDIISLIVCSGCKIPEPVSYTHLTLPTICSV